MKKNGFYKRKTRSSVTISFKKKVVILYIRKDLLNSSFFMPACYISRQWKSFRVGENGQVK